MKKMVSIILIILTTAILLGCSEKEKEKEPIEKAQDKVVEIGEAFLNYEITADEAIEMLDGILVPDTETGVATTSLEADIGSLTASLIASKSPVKFSSGYTGTYSEIAEKVEHIKNEDYIGFEKRYNEIVNK